MLTALDEALPDGLDVLEVVESAGGSLADRLEASIWRITVPGLTADEAAQAVRRFLDAEHVTVERMTKKGTAQLRLPRGRRVARRAVRTGNGRRCVRYSKWSYGTELRP